MTDSISRKFARLGLGVSETGTLTVNSATASKWATARTITLSGDLSGNVSIDGSENVTLTATVSGNTVALGTDTTGNYIAEISAGTGITVSGSGSETATATIGIDSTVATLSGSQTLTNKTISGATNTLSNIGNNSLTNSSVTVNGTTIALGASGTLVTDDIAEDGTPVNLWFTNARARGAVSATDAGGDGSFTYDSGTGVFTYTGPSASEVRAHLSAGTGLTYTTGQFALAASGVTANTYGSATAVPVLTIDTYGRITSASTASVSSSIAIAGDTGTDSVSLISDTLTFTGGTGITSAVTNNTVTLDIDNTVTTNSGSQTLTNKTISGADNTLSNIGNSSLTNSSITINGTSTSLGGTRTLVTDDIAEDGSPVNLWFTNARARGAVSVTDSGGDGSLTYDSGTGVFTYTGPSASEVRAHFSAGTGVAISSGQVSIGQAVGTSDNVTFAGATIDAVRVGVTAANEIDTSSGNLTLDSTGGTVTIDDDANITGNLTIDGNLTVSGTTVTINATNLAVEDNMIYLNNGSQVTNPDLGFAGNYNDGTYRHAGLFRDATDGVWKFFHQYTLEPDASAYIDTAHGSFALAAVQASTFTGNLTGNVTGNVTGNASTATAWATGRTLTLSGDVTGTSAAFDGSGNISITTTITADSVALGTDTSGNYVASITNGSYITGGNGGSEGAALTIAVDATSANTASKVVARDGSGNFSAGTITANLTGNVTGNVTGNASTATTLQTQRAINGVAFNGSADITVADSTKLPLSGGTLTGVLTMATTGTQYIRMGRFPNSTNNTGEAWIGRASDRQSGVMTVQLGTDNNSNFEVVDYAWSTVIFQAGMNSISYKGNAILHAGNYNSYSPTLTGTGASGTWGINITGNAATATSATDSTKLPLSGGTITGDLVVNSSWGTGGYTEQLTIYGTYPSWTTRSTTSGTGWLFHTEASGHWTLYSIVGQNTDNWTQRYTFNTDGTFRNGGPSGSIYLHAGNYNSYSPTLTGGGASGTWGINISGNAATVTNGLTTSNYSSYAIPVGGGINMSGSFGLNDSRLYLRTNGDTNHYLWNADDDYEELRAYTYSGFRVRSSGGEDLLIVYGAGNGGYSYSPYSFRAPIFYDSNDTGYYLDANGYSSLSVVGIGSGTNSGGTYFYDAYVDGNSAYYHQPQTRIRRDSSATGTIDQAPVALFLHNENGTNNTWVKLSMGGREAAGSGNTVSWAGIAARKTSGTANSWASGQLHLWAKSGGSQNIGLFIDSSGYAQSDYSLRAPIFYDSNNTGYYTDQASTSNYNAMVSYSYQGNGNVGGTGSASWHPSGIYSAGYNWLYGGINGGGSSGTNFSDLRATIFYDYDNTGYYLNPNSTSYLYNLELAGGGYFRPNNWIQLDGGYGLYWPNNYGAHLYPNSGSTYTQLRTDGQKNGYDGIWLSYSAVAGMMYDGSGNGGVYREANGRWYFYHLVGNNCMGIGTSTTNSAYGVYVVKGGYFDGRVDGTIFYDANNTAYYCDPNGTARLSYVVANGGIRIDGNENLYLDNNYGQSIVGVYTSTRYQGIFAMGNSYKLPIDGNGTSNLYGLAWSHPNAGGVAGNLNTHGMLVMENGTFLAAVSGSIRARDDMRAPIYYDSDSTGYYVNPYSTSSLNAAYFYTIYHHSLGGGYYFTNGDWGWRHQTPSGYIQFGPANSSYAHIYTDRGNFYYNVDYSYFNGRHVVSQDVWLGNQYIANDGRHYYTIWYDTNDTNYYVDPTGTSRMRNVITDGGRFLIYGGATGEDGTADAQLCFTSGGGLTIGSITTSFFTGFPGSSYPSNRQIGFRMDYDKRFYVWQDVIQYYSDERLKEKTGTLSGALDAIKSWTPFKYVDNDLAKSFNFANSKTQIGLSAQEVEEFYPELVELAPFDCENDFSDPTNPRRYSKSGENYLTLNYARIVPVLVQAIKEQQAKIEELENRINNS